MSKMKKICIIAIVLVLIILAASFVSAKSFPDSGERDGGKTLASHLDDAYYDYIFCGQGMTFIYTSAGTKYKPIYLERDPLETYMESDGITPKELSMEEIIKKIDGLDAYNWSKAQNAISKYTNEHLEAITPEVAYGLYVFKLLTEAGITVDYSTVQNYIWKSDMNTGQKDTSYGGTMVNIQALLTEAKEYTKYHKKIEAGHQPKSMNSKDDIKVVTDYAKQKYVAGPFKIDYEKGRIKSGVMASKGQHDILDFGKITDIYVKTNYGKEKIVLVPAKNDAESIDPEDGMPAPGKEFYIEFYAKEGTTSTSLHIDFEFLLLKGEFLKATGVTENYTWVSTGNDKYFCNEDNDDDVMDLGSATARRTGTGSKRKWTGSISCSTCDKKYTSSGHSSSTRAKDGAESKAEKAHYKRSLYKLTLTGSPGTQDIFITTGPGDFYGLKEEIIKKELDIPFGNPLDYTMELGGKVWYDTPDGKQNTGNGTFDGGEALPGIIAELYEKGGKLVKVAGTKSDGSYKFEKLDPLKKYYVAFVYDGTKNVNVKYSLTGENTSRATEDSGDRTALNNRFKSIEAYPGNYQATNGRRNPVYTVAEMAGIYDTYKRVATGYEGASIDAIYNQLGASGEQLQFLKDCQIRAYTGDSGKGNPKLYPTNDRFEIGDKDETVNGDIYKAIYPEMKQINLGIETRGNFDLSLRKDLYNAFIEFKGTSKSFRHNIRSEDIATFDVSHRKGDYYQATYKQGINKADHKWKYGDYLNPQDSKYTAEDELKVFAIYKIKIANTSDTALRGAVTELVDYYDDKLTFVESTYNTSGGKTGKLNWTTQSKFGSGNKSTANSGMKALYTTGLDSEVMGTGQYVQVVMKFEVNKDANKEVILDPVNGIGKQNVTEINGYRTEIGGYLDYDSVPGNTLPTDKPDSYQDDADKAPGFVLNYTEEQDRTIAGYVWEDERDKGVVEIDNGVKIADGLRSNEETKYVNDVLVELYEKQDDGQDLLVDFVRSGVPKDGQNNIAEGQYAFERLPLGEYYIRYTYGDATQLEKNTKYNGQDYKSTKTQGELNEIKKEKQKAEILIGIEESLVMHGTNYGIAKETSKEIVKSFYNMDDIELSMGLALVGTQGHSSNDYRLPIGSNNKEAMMNAINGMPERSMAYELPKIMETLNDVAQNQFSNDDGTRKVLVFITQGGWPKTEGKQAIDKFFRDKGYELVTITLNVYGEYGGQLQWVESGKPLTPAEYVSHPSQIWGDINNPYCGKVYDGVGYPSQTEDAMEGIRETILGISNGKYFDPNKSYARDLWRTDYDSNRGIEAFKNIFGRDRVIDYSDNDLKYSLGNKLDKLTQNGSAPNNIAEEVVLNTKMTAETEKIVIGHKHKNTDTAEVNLGLQERSETKLDTKIDIVGIKVTLNNGTTLFDIYEGIDPTQIKGVQMIPEDGKYKFNINMDEELMNGATVTIKYKITIKNNSELDSKLAYLEGENADIVTTRPEEVYIYTEPNVVFRQDDNKDGNTLLWNNISGENDVNILDPDIKENINYKNDRNSTVANGIKALTGNDLLTATKPGESKEEIITLSKLLSPQNYNSSDSVLDYIGSVEIVGRENGVGRRDYRAVPGNYDPNSNHREPDDDVTREIIITPPTGQTRIYYVLIALVIIIAVAGIILLKKFVIDKNKE